MPDRWMYQAGAAMGEKTSKEEKVTATIHTQALTYQQKIELRLESSHLRRSKAIVVILIEFPID